MFLAYQPSRKLVRSPHLRLKQYRYFAIHGEIRDQSIAHEATHQRTGLVCDRKEDLRGTAYVPGLLGSLPPIEKLERAALASLSVP